MRAANTPFVLIIRDGWGTNPHPDQDSYNAISLARTPVADRLMDEWPWTLIKTSGEDVGQPPGKMGNSEVGHQNIGAGRVVDQESVRITKACRAGLGNNDVLAGAIRAAKAGGNAVHLMGVSSDAGVHGMIEHLYALLRLCKRIEHDKVFVHLFADGRDTGPHTGVGFAAEVESECRLIGVGHVVSVIGRYWAMDRDNRWERVKRAYDCLTGRGECPRFRSAAEAIEDYYENPIGETMHGDEFVTPRCIAKTEEGVRDSRVRDGDTVIFYNYRGDRPRELCRAFLFPEFHGSETIKPSPDTGHRGFDRGPKLNLHFVMMTAYSECLLEYAAVAFPKPPKMVDIAGSYLSRLGLTQFRCAETEKFPHVTFFFNDYREKPFDGESREIIQSPNVPTYDLKPEMSAEGVRDAVLRRLEAPDGEDVIIVNFANPDMVGHTGNLKAAITACEVVDRCVGAIVDAALAAGGSCIITADHGNAEQMGEPDSDFPHTAHTVFDVPTIIVGEAFRHRALRGDRETAGWFDPAVRARRGRLGDILPTALDMMGLDKPDAMTGASLLEPAKGARP